MWGQAVAWGEVRGVSEAADVGRTNKGKREGKVVGCWAAAGMGNTGSDRREKGPGSSRHWGRRED